jgi:hypothetical protein
MAGSERASEHERGRGERGREGGGGRERGREEGICFVRAADRLQSA